MKPLLPLVCERIGGEFHKVRLEMPNAADESHPAHPRPRPNVFEIAILQSLARKEPSLHSHMDQLHVLSREFTGVGSFTSFACEDPSQDSPDQWLALEDAINVPGLKNGMGAVLFCKGGKPQCLEVFTYDEEWEGSYDGFTIERSIW